MMAEKSPAPHANEAKMNHHREKRFEDAQAKRFKGFRAGQTSACPLSGPVNEPALRVCDPHNHFFSLNK
jgi:hypothetical protein